MRIQSPPRNRAQRRRLKRVSRPAPLVQLGPVRPIHRPNLIGFVWMALAALVALAVGAQLALPGLVEGAGIPAAGRFWAR